MKNQTFVLALIVAISCQRSTPAVVQSGNAMQDRLAPQLPTGVRLDPAAPLTMVGSMPLSMRAAPGNDERVVLLLSGYAQQGLQVISTKTGAVLQTVLQPAAFYGLAFSPDGKTLYASGGNQDVVYTYDWSPSGARLRDSMVLAPKTRSDATRYPAGIAVSADGKWLYVAENLADSVAVIDIASGKVIQRLMSGRYPYDVVVGPDHSVYVSNWGGEYLAAYAQMPDGRLRDADWIEVGRHPSALTMDRTGNRLYAALGSVDKIAVVDLPNRRVAATLNDAPPAGPSEGATPNAVALDANGDRLFVAEADANAVAVFDTRSDSLIARIPTGWYPSALLVTPSDLWVADGKGVGTHANPNGSAPSPKPGTTPSAIPGLSAFTNAERTVEYTLHALRGGVMHLPLSDLTTTNLAAYTKRVASANGWENAKDRRGFPPIQHVVYIIKENRTYDQVLGDLKGADGDSSLVYFPRSISPNHHALAERFGIFDRFFVNAEVSPDGHNWSTQAYANDYLEKTVPSNYSGRGRTYDYEGTNRNQMVDDDDAAEGGSGYLWDMAARKNITFRDYGEFATTEGRGRGRGAGETPRAIGTKPSLREHVNPRYPVFNTAIKDQVRADVWLEDLAADVKAGSMPALQILRLGNDHTSYAQAGRPTPKAAFADNDLAVGRIVEALSKTPFWTSTAVFVLEDDAQNGSDHVDSHRSPMFIISPWSRPGVYHRFANTTDVLRTIEELLGLGSMSQFDYFGRPIREIWSDKPDAAPYTAITPGISLDELNPRGTREGQSSSTLDLSAPDRVDDELGNRILWRMLKGSTPYPGAKKASTAEFVRP